MKTATAAKIAEQFNAYLEASQSQPVLITRNGRPVAVLLAVENESDAQRLASRQSRPLRSVFEEASKQLGEGKGIPHDEFWRQVEESRRAKRKTTARRKKT